MATDRRTPEYGRRAGMWSTITAAVQAGWGATVRLLTVLAVLGVLLIVTTATATATATAGDSDIVVMLRTLLAGIR